MLRCSRRRRASACARVATTRRRGSVTRRWCWGATIGDSAVEARALTALGPSLFASGEVDAGVAALREALEIARANDLPDELSPEPT